MIKKLALVVVLLGVALLTLTGCFTKSSRRFIEGKAAELSKVYSTENLEDLFEKFPGGFQIRITDTEQKDENSPSLNQEITLSGIPETKEIKGKVIKSTSQVNANNKYEETTDFEADIYYKGGRIYIVNSNDASQDVLKHSRLLMQEFSISRSSLKNLEVVRKGYSFETGSASITYNLKNEQVNDYLGLESGAQINMDINIFESTIAGKSYGYTVIFRKDNLYHSEGIVGKLEEN
ncbi:hypothetical protein [Streptococcus oralis]|uniref:Lipoprotein n=1 Tax=Streptococcus oralis subsp. oralis TaxID=1891914 RepID=A0ABD6RKJ3_STROR|nr:hypothetical protein [Streptococcus oralis]MCY7072607.1 hypothetical protein [Streptococcus oralis]ORO74011.1 hypothetical protein B7710_02085 [Streptococcus oralis subsp. oralis]ORO74481.1 hypothetical protein B7711_01815 [Streptococcus oralis subsp. oralis]